VIRIIAGRARGTTLQTPEGRHTRPTRAAVREAAFSMLASRLDFQGLRVLDLFAGSGALGLEAWSRGCAELCLIEKSRSACRIIHSNLEKARASQDATLLCAPLPNALHAPPAATFDLVLADPPYASPNTLLSSSLQALCEHQWLSPEAYLLLEHHQHDEFEPPSALHAIVQRQYGINAVSLLQYRPLLRKEDTQP
jgi:16S rRNA (guanine966-N2)-methyltransferase